MPPLTGRRLLAPGPTRTNVTRQLHGLPPTLPITDLTTTVLDTMWNLHDCFRTVMSTDDSDSNWWVFGAKLCARKRPLLFPVRDSVVCTYLSDGIRMGSGPGKLGVFSRAIQVFAYLMTAPSVRRALTELRHLLSRTEVGAEVDWSDLRLLDVSLWTAGQSGSTMTHPGGAVPAE